MPVVFGNPAFFNVEQTKKILSKQNLHSKYGVNPNRKVLLLATEYLNEYYHTHGKYNYNSLMWKYLLEHFGNKNDYFIILKPHPNENTSIYEKILSEYKTNNAQIIQGDLFELLFICTVVIAVFSNDCIDH